MNKAIILAGGQGKRMKADMPKPLFKVLGEPMLEWVISACEGAGISDICVIKGFMGEMIDEYLGGRYTTALQAERLGTGHAVMQAISFMKDDESGNTLACIIGNQRSNRTVTILCFQSVMFSKRFGKNDIIKHLYDKDTAFVRFFREEREHFFAHFEGFFIYFQCKRIIF